MLRLTVEDRAAAELQSHMVITERPRFLLLEHDAWAHHSINQQSARSTMLSIGSLPPPLFDSLGSSMSLHALSIAQIRTASDDPSFT